MFILLLCLAAVLVVLPALEPHFSCPETGEDHEWMHERGPNGWHLVCRACLHRSHGLGVWSRH